MSVGDEVHDPSRPPRRGDRVRTWIAGPVVDEAGEGAGRRLSVDVTDAVRLDGGRVLLDVEAERAGRERVVPPLPRRTY